jgi:hypothetical protein
MALEARGEPAMRVGVHLGLLGALPLLSALPLRPGQACRALKSSKTKDEGSLRAASLNWSPTGRVRLLSPPTQQENACFLSEDRVL